MQKNPPYHDKHKTADFVFETTLSVKDKVEALGDFIILVKSFFKIFLACGLKMIILSGSSLADKL